MTLNQMASSSTAQTSKVSLDPQTIPLIPYHRLARDAAYPMTEEYSSISNVMEITSTVPQHINYMTQSIALQQTYMALSNKSLLKATM